MSKELADRLEWIDEARQIAAQCWCDPETEQKIMDPVLAEAIAKRIALWMETGARHAKNEEYWRERATKAEEAIAALRSEPATPYSPEYLYNVAVNTLIPTDRRKNDALAALVVALEQPDAAPSREPTHLYQCCDCGRKSWDEGDELAHCNFPQPNGKRCAGQMLPIAPSRESRTDECVINPVMSCVCKRGTKSCVITHADPSRTDRQGNPDSMIAAEFNRLNPLPTADRQEPGLSADEMLGDEFDAWWKREGRFIRAGGGDYERSFAWGAWKDAMALLSLRGTFADGIEAAAKLIRKRLDGIYEDHSYTEQDTGATVIDNAETECLANELEELEEEIRALAQDQRSEQSSGLNGDVSSVSPRSSSSAPNGVERTGNSASIDAVTGRRDGHPTEQDAAELLREALDAYDHIVVKTGYQGDFDTSAGRAHLARKEPK